MALTNFTNGTLIKSSEVNNNFLNSYYDIYQKSHTATSGTIVDATTDWVDVISVTLPANTFTRFLRVGAKYGLDRDAGSSGAATNYRVFVDSVEYDLMDLGTGSGVSLRPSNDGSGIFYSALELDSELDFTGTIDVKIQFKRVDWGGSTSSSMWYLYNYVIGGI